MERQKDSLKWTGTIATAFVSFLVGLITNHILTRNNDRSIAKDLRIHRAKLYLDHIAEYSKHTIERLEKAHFTISQLRLHFSKTGAYIIACAISEMHEFHDWYFEQCEKVHSILSTMALHAPDGKEKQEETYGYMNNFWCEMHSAMEKALNTTANVETRPTHIQMI